MPERWAAGDAIKEDFHEAKIAALETYECSTLTDGGRGQHRIEGIGDKMCTLIHNVLTTDFVVQIKDEDCVRGLKVLHDGTDILIEMGVRPETAAAMKDLFGVSGVCNILGAIKMAKYLRLIGPDDNVVTIATDGYRPVRFGFGRSAASGPGNRTVCPAPLGPGHLPASGTH